MSLKPSPTVPLALLGIELARIEDQQGLIERRATAMGAIEVAYIVELARIAAFEHIAEVGVSSIASALRGQFSRLARHRRQWQPTRAAWECCVA